MESLGADCLHYVFGFLSDRDLTVFHTSSRYLYHTPPNLRRVIPTLNYLVELQRSLAAYSDTVYFLRSSTKYPESVNVSFKLTNLKTVRTSVEADVLTESVGYLVKLCFHQAVAPKCEVVLSPTNVDYLGTRPNRLTLPRWYSLPHPITVSDVGSTNSNSNFKPGLVKQKGSNVWW